MFHHNQGFYNSFRIIRRDSSTLGKPLIISTRLLFQQSDLGGHADQQLQSDSSNSSMSISPATSEVGSPRGASGSKSNATSTRALFNELTSFNIKKGIKKSVSGNFGQGINKESVSISSGRRIRTSSHSSSTSSFSSSSKVGSRKELDRADMDLDWRSTSRLRCSSGSSEESIKTKKSDDKLPNKVNRADRDLNWRNHDDIQSNSFIRSQRGNWRSENQRRHKMSESGKNLQLLTCSKNEQIIANVTSEA